MRLGSRSECVHRAAPCGKLTADAIITAQPTGEDIERSIVDHYIILGALVGAIVWNVITWWYGLPSSSSHALIGGLAGAAVAKGGFQALVGSGFLKISLAIVLSPMLGFALGMLLMSAVAWIFFRTRPNKVDRWFRRFQLVSAAMYSLGHGGNDAQKTRGAEHRLGVGVDDPVRGVHLGARVAVRTPPALIVKPRP
jgi:phosphate/sulfate permease